MPWTRTSTNAAVGNCNQEDLASPTARLTRQEEVDAGSLPHLSNEHLLDEVRLS